VPARRRAAAVAPLKRFGIERCVADWMDALATVAG
jgi:hypothetical protein